MLKLKLNRAESAKECFMEALALDVKCYEAFDQLISGEMMTADEGEYFPCVTMLFSYQSRVGVRSKPGLQAAAA